MKLKYLVLALTAVTLPFSCSEYEGPNNPVEQEIEITITANAESSSGSRTEYQEADGSVLWTPGDEISLFYGSGYNGGSRFTSTATDKSATTEFTGTISALTNHNQIVFNGDYFYGVYPYSQETHCSNNTVSLTLSSYQVGQAGSFERGKAPSIGRSQGLSMNFYNVCGGIKFSVSRPGIKMAEFRGNNLESMLGNACFAFGNSDVPEMQYYNWSTNYICFYAPDEKGFEVGKFYYIMMFPTYFSNGFNLTLFTDSGRATIYKNDPVYINRSVFGRLEEIDKDATFIDSQNIPIPDANFKAYLVSNFDQNGDGEINTEEAANINSINVKTDNIYSVSGIEYFPNLEVLRCYGSSSSDVNNQKIPMGKLTSIDVSNNPHLKDLRCYYNQLTSLDVSKNPYLNRLSCYYNQLTSLDVSNNPELTSIGCYFNRLTSLDVSDKYALETLSCHDNQLTSLTVSNDPAITIFYCHNNQLTNLDISSLKSLSFLYCYGNKLSSLDVSYNFNLSNFDCSPMSDDYGNNLLETLYISNGQIIPYVTYDRSPDIIPDATEIVQDTTKSTYGGGYHEGYQEINL